MLRYFRNYIFLLILAGALALAGCGDFFVSQNAINTVSFTPNSVLLKSGTDSITLVPLVTTVGGTQTNPTSGVTWTSSNDAIAAIDATGKLTAGTTSGNATITVKYSNVSGTGTAIVTAGTLPGSITVAPANGTIILSSGNPRLQYSATAALNGNSSYDLTSFVTWSSSNTAVATVSSSGLVTGISGCGFLTGISCPTITATISLATGSTITGTATISSIQ